MADKTDNIKTKLSFDGEAQYKAACKEINSTLKLLNSEMKLVTAEYKNNASSAEALKAKQEVLKKTYDEQKKKVEETEKALAKCKEETGENSEASKKLETQLNYQKTALANTEAELEKTATELDKTEKAADDMGDEVEDSGKQAEDAKGKFSGLKDTLATVGKACVAAVAAIGTAAVAAGKKLYDMASETAAAGDKVDKASQKVGLSAEAYQKWDYAMGLAGTSMDTCKGGLKKLTDAIDDANNGNKTAIERFERLGISVDDLKGKSREDIFGMTIEALQNVSDETERAALANDVFGKSGSELAPLLNQGAEATAAALEEAEKYGMVMSNEAVAASAAFCDAQAKLQGTFTGVKNSITSDMLPSLTLVMNGLSDLMAGNEEAGEEIKKGVTGVISSISEMIPQILEVVTSIADAVLESAPAIIQALAQGIIDALPKMLPTITKVMRL